MNSRVLRRLVSVSLLVGSLAVGTAVNAQAVAPHVAVRTAATTTVSVPRVTAAPRSAHLTAGQVAKFSVTATGGRLSYQWQILPAGSTAWRNIAKATSTTYTLRSATAANGQHFRVLASNARGRAYSAAALLTVNSTRADPIKTGTAINLTAWKVNVTGTNSNGWPAVRAANMYNDPPRAGNRYVIGTVAIKDLSVTQDPAYDLEVQFVGGNGRTYDEAGVDYGDSLYSVNTMYRNAVATFEVVMEVPAAAVAGGRWLITDSSNYDRITSAFYDCR